MKRTAIVLSAVLSLGAIAPSLAAIVANTADNRPAQTIAARRDNQKRVGELNDAIKKAIASDATAASQLALVQERDDRTHLLKA